MTAFLLLFALSILVVEASSSSSSKFPCLPAFYNKVENGISDRRRSLTLLSTFQEQHNKAILAFRGGAAEETEVDDDDKKEAAVETVAGNDVDEVTEDDEDTEDENKTTDDESSEEDTDEDDYYDDETDEEVEDSVLAYQLKKKSSSQEKSTEAYVEPYFISPSLQMYTTFGTILLSRKIDMFSPKVVRVVRLLFVLHLVVQQAFIIYIRVMAKRNNDRTPVDVENPLTNMLSSQLEKQQAGGNDMVKNLASSFLKKESTVVEYDMGQAMKMQGGILFNMALMWLLHFKMQQVQPLLVTSINGFMQLVYNPLFQVYVLGRNLERPFKAPEVFKDPSAEEQSDDTETTTQEEATETATEESEVDEAGKAVDNDSEDESSDDEDESSDDESDESSDDEEDPTEDDEEENE